MSAEIGLVERWAKALAEVGMMTLHYPMFTSDKRKIKLKIKEKTEERIAYPLQSMAPSF